MNCRLFCTLIILSLNLTMGVVAQDETTPEPIDPTTVSAGPFISWLSDSSLQIDYVCYGEPQHDTVTIDSQAIIPHHCLSYLPGNQIIKRSASIPSETNFANVSPLLAVSDIHGEFEYLISFLKQNQVIDDSLNWQWGKGHLVFNGDIFDRGDIVFETLWLIYRLQEQAPASGGMVHLIMGNHELMVLRGDERYLNPVYTDVIIPILGTTHQELVGQNSILGDWLRTLPAMIVIDSLLFVHGGISMELVHAGITIDQINQASRQYLDITSDSLKADSLASLLYKSQGPFWNRTMVWEYKQPQLTAPQLDSVLSYFGVRVVVVGHSEHDSLTALFDNHLFAIDTPVEESGGFEGFLLRDNQFYRVTPDGLLHPLVSIIVPPDESEQ